MMSVSISVLLLNYYVDNLYQLTFRLSFLLRLLLLFQAYIRLPADLQQRSRPYMF